MPVATDLRAAESVGSQRSDLIVLVGEIHTGILQNSAPISTETATELLTLGTYQPVRTWERPVRHAASPQILRGVDCLLPSAAGHHRRVVGTVAVQARTTAGRVLQTCAWSGCAPAAEGRRLAWSHYLTRPATLEVFTDLRPDDVVTGFLHRPAGPGTLDLSGICAGLFAQVQSSPAIDQGAPLRASRTRLRWSATPTSPQQPPSVRLVVGTDGTRTLEVAAPLAMLPQVPALCEDVAAHDWLLFTLIAIIDLANVGGRERIEVVRHLQPAVDDLLHVWMPAARLPSDLMPFWVEIENRSGLSRQWEVLVQRIRDQLVLATLEPAARRPAHTVDVRAGRPEVASS